MAAPRWLTDDEQRAWRAYVESTKLVFDLIDRQLQRDADMPHAYWEILVRLSERPDRRLRMSELADVTRSSRSRLSHAVARLEERGWVEREDCETDRRGSFAVLTDAGHAALVAAAPGHVEQVREVLVDRLGPERLAELGRISTALLEGLAAEGHTPNGAA
ncbi:MAG: MarR family winged helix-turn-helix transcriptional regulator [Jatrophihabitans sp.]|uniref:MarR family winged helix-turn-helix transcriptional regulator n=1 Tax=Jatrophihabitans sp. TaxID=1932789 RepID=UPI003F7DC7CA